MTVINHVGLRVTDIDASIRFYEALGFEEKLRMDVPDEAIEQLLQVPSPSGTKTVYLTLGSFVLELIGFLHHEARANDRSFTDAGLTHLSVGVDDMAAAKQAVVDAGGEIVEGTDVGAAVMARDPDGQLVEVMEEKLRPVTPE
jgi:lactoylglutathione lyase